MNEKMDKENSMIFGPFENFKSLYFLELTTENLTVIKTNFFLSIKIILNEHLGVFENSISKIKEGLVDNTQLEKERIKCSELTIIKLKKNRLWKHQITIKTKNRNISFYLRNREEFHKIENAFRKHLSEKLTFNE